MSTAYWEHFEHQADMGVRGFGQTIEEAFAQAALAMMAIITDPSRIQPQQAIEISCHDADRELLLVDWLNAIIYEMATRKMLFNHFDISIAEGQPSASAWGEAIDRHRHSPAVEIKGATYTQLRVAETQGQWLAQCVVDV